MQEKEFHMSAPNLVNVCIDQTTETGKSGRMYCGYLRQAICFENEWQLLKQMEGLMDELDYPQSSMKTRSYQKKESEQKHQKPEKVLESNEMMQMRGLLGTAVIQVKYRQHATWQGQMIHVETNQIFEFSSALELLKLMDQEF